MKKLSSSSSVLCLTIILFSFSAFLAFGSIISKKTAQPQSIDTAGESGFRISSLGGTVEVLDLQSPVYGAGVTFGVRTYRSDKASVSLSSLPSEIDIPGDLPKSLKGRLTYNTTKKLLFLQLKLSKKEKNQLLTLSKNSAWKKAVKELFQKSERGETSGDALYTVKQWSEGGTVEEDENGNPRILVPTGEADPNKDRPTSSTVLVLYVDSDDEDNDPDTFPSFRIKEFKDNTFTAYGDLPTTGTITLIQVLEPPAVTIEIPQLLSFLKIPEDVKGASGNVIGVGHAVSFSILDELHSGSTMVGGLSPEEFVDYATIKVPYSKDAVTALGIDTSKLRLYELHKNEWRNITKGLSVDTDNGIVSAKVKEFSIFQVVAPYKNSNSLPLITNFRQTVNENGEAIEKSFKAVTVEGGKGNIKITYSLQDTEEEPSDVLIEYRQSPGTDSDTGWTKIAKKRNIDNGINSYTWKSTSSTTGIGSKSGYFQIRITPSQKIDGKTLNGGSGYSEIFRINNAKTAIKPPTKLEGEVVDDVDAETPPQVSLAWTASTSSDVSGYNVYRQARFDTGFEKTFRKIGESASIPFTDDTFTSSFYEAIYKLTAFDSSGNESAFSGDIKLASLVMGAYYY